MTVQRLAAQAPATDLVVETGQRVGHGVVVGPDRQAVELEVVAGVDDHGQVGADWAARPSAIFAPPTPPASRTTVM